MTPQEIETRLHDLGAPIVWQDFQVVEHLHLAREGFPVEFAPFLLKLLPRSVTLNAKSMTINDLDVMLHFPRLSSICAHSLPFAAEALKAVSEYAPLQSVAMSSTSIMESDLSCLAGRCSLRSLHLAATKLTDDAMSVFATLPKLEVLDLRGTQVSDEGLHHLTKLRNVFTIDVRGTAVTRHGANAFRADVASVLPDLEVLTGDPPSRRTQR